MTWLAMAITVVVGLVVLVVDILAYLVTSLLSKDEPETTINWLHNQRR